MDQQQEMALEVLLDAELRREGLRHPARYKVRPHGDDWAIVDCAHNRPDGRVVRVTRWRAIAQSVCIFANELGSCVRCAGPGTVLCYGEVLCIDCIPPYEGSALIPLSVLRIWRASDYR
jgi:hypothetical protein